MVNMIFYIVVPSLKISGGIREALRLATDLNDGDIETGLISMWVSPAEMKSQSSVKYLSSWQTRPKRALCELPIIACRFSKWLRQAMPSDCYFIFTHYATLPLALLVPRRRRLFFVQGLEWTFLRNRLLSRALRLFLIRIYKTGTVIAANSYLSEQLSVEGVERMIEAPIWADPSFLVCDATEQDIDFVMVLRKGSVKRLDLYMQFIELARKSIMRVAVITPDDDIATQVDLLVCQVLLRPSLEQMRDLYARSTCFIHLSESEGFGLPPLEAMGAGCIPICRDSGGVRAFMQDDPFSSLLLPLSLPLNEVFNHAKAVVLDKDNFSRDAARTCFKKGLVRCEQARKGLVGSVVLRNL